MVSLVLPSLTKECEGHMEKHSQGSQLNATLHTAMNAHITNLRMLALPPEQLQAQLPPAQPPKSKIKTPLTLLLKSHVFTVYAEMSRSV